ncbi:MAG TPA: ABC transporter permease [Stellaceae bacterium]|nr:ABC transporter permease [Stellaceae bacterium]
MSIFRLLLTRILQGALLILAVVVFDFLLIHLAPGDPAQMLAGQLGGATAEILAQIRQEYGLDQSVWVQLWTYIRHVATGDLGTSYYYNLPVLSLILQRLPATLLLVVTAQLSAIVAGTFLGAVAAKRPDAWLSRLVDVTALIGYATPVFWLGIMLLILFAYLWPVFPVSGMETVGFSGDALARLLNLLHHLVLPAFTLAFIYLAQYSRLASTNMQNVLRADYIRFARAKGLPERTVTYKHALRNAALPVVTIAGLQFGSILAGAVLVETVFDWPGMGQLTYDSILRRDYPLLIGILLMSAVVVVVVNILTDLSYRIIDPRLRRSP